MKILIVDDEPGLAAGLAAWLVENGWDAPGVAATSDEAVEWINQNERADVLICDVFIKPADGLTLREAVQAYLPKMKTIFMSRFDVSQHAARMEGCPVLTKPVNGYMLDEAIRSLYEPAPAAPVVKAVVAKTASRVVAATAPRAVAKAFVPVSPKASTPGAVTAVPSVPIAATPKATVPKGAARPAAVPVARPKNVPAGQKAIAEIELPPDDLVGGMIGTYQIEARIGTGSQGAIYRAIQTNMGRPVRLYTLDRERAQNPAEIERFIANASVKANVSHHNIFAVYEAGESDGIYFYSCEYVPCRSLGQLREGGKFLDENAALQVLKVVSEVMAYFAINNITHSAISANAILLDQNNRPRVANIAAYQVEQDFSQSAEMAQLGNVITGVLPEDSAALGVRQLAVTLAEDPSAYPSWPALAQAAIALEPKVAPEDAYKLDAQERAAIRMVEEAKKRRKKSMILSTLVSLSILSAALGSGWWAWQRSRGAQVEDFNRSLEIPAGAFIYQNGQKTDLPAFYIDEYEVTIGQYAKFLADIKAHPEKLSAIEHPDQPKDKSHVPEKWANEDLSSGLMYGYYERSKRWGKYHDAALDVNSPVFGVDWFDAFAYAKWKGRRLPTEKEWEKAARGTEGFTYPWGSDDEPKFVNSGNDTNPDPKKGGEIDNHDRWSPVNAMKKDRSPFGVMDMAGNVSEWTASTETDPMMSSQKVPVIRGGNWRTPKDYAVTRRVLKLTATQNDEALGFRTASDTAPASTAP